MSLPDIRIQNTGEAQSNVPFTFGQVFKAGDLMQGEGLAGKLSDGSTIPLQVDFKASHGDKSVRHAIVSGVLLSLAKGATAKFDLVKAANIIEVVKKPFPLWSVTITFNGKKYMANSQVKEIWLDGPLATELTGLSWFIADDGSIHPHMSVSLAMRCYANGQTRFDIALENAFAYEPNPQNFTYDVLIEIGGKAVFSQTALTHYHHARWRKLFWTGAEPAIHIQHNTAYLIETKALPNYDQSIVFPESTLAALGDQYAGTNTGPMGLGLSMAYMPTTGGRPDIGLLPGWAATYLLTMDKRAKDATLGTAQLAGSYSSHFRDKNTGKPISLIDYPYMTVIDPHVGDTWNPVTDKLEAFPASGGDMDSPYTWDVSHQPAYAFLPYLVTGDFYFLEELQFWAMVNVFNGHPGYRENKKGLVNPEQTRGAAWSLRTLGEAAYITPDTDRLKGHFASILSDNLDWYNKNTVGSNALGVETNGYAYSYMEETGIAPWQDDFFTSAIGHLVDLGFEKAGIFQQWKAKFPVIRMISPGCCWINGAAPYSMKVRPSRTEPVFSTMAEVYAANNPPEIAGLGCNSPAMAAALGLKVGEMVGYADGELGYPSDMQPALASSVDAKIPGAQQAWDLFMSRTVKPDYSRGPQLAIVPRSTQSSIPPVVIPPPVQPPAPPVGSPITPPVSRTGKVVTPSSTALVAVMKATKAKQFTYQIFDIQDFLPIREFKNAAPSSKGVFTLIDPVLYISKKRQLAGKVLDANGKVLLVHYPLTVV